MNEKVREQFEAWAVTSAWLGLGYESEMARDGEGYAETEVHTAWIAWQASREWIELPKPHIEFDGDPAPEMFASQVYAAVGVKPKC